MSLCIRAYTQNFICGLSDFQGQPLILFKFDYGNAAVALSELSYSEACNSFVASEIRPKSVFQCARALAVNKPYGMEARYGSIVKVFVNHAPSLVSRHSSEVYLASEISTYADLYIRQPSLLAAQAYLSLVLDKL